MTTVLQLEANRRNALHSTGPRTEAGRARSALNGMTHGLTSRLGVAIDRGPFAEDPTDVEFFISEVVRGLEPQGAQSGPRPSTSGPSTSGCSGCSGWSPPRSPPPRASQ